MEHLCKICGDQFSSHNLMANHVRWKHKREHSQRTCQHCGKTFEPMNIASHERRCIRWNICVRCGKQTRNQKFCSHACSATFTNFAGTTGYSTYRVKHGIQPTRTYRDVCFDIWEPKCVICGWDISVDVHHIDSNHKNHDPNNMIPLCANHHMMTRMAEHRDTIKEQLLRIVIGRLSKEDTY